jgi:hypothetical protein
MDEEEELDIVEAGEDVEPVLIFQQHSTSPNATSYTTKKRRRSSLDNEQNVSRSRRY